MINTITVNKSGKTTVRLSDEDLHTTACKYLWESNHVVFEAMPSAIEQIIEHKIWQTGDRNFKNFGEYALDQSSSGLGIRNNRMLWLLRCSMDIKGRHATHWIDVLAEVDKTVRLYAKQQNLSIRKFDGNSLESLGKNWTDAPTDQNITFLPSRSKNNEARLLRLRHQDYKTYRKVISGQLKLDDVFPSRSRSEMDPLARIENSFLKLTNAERKKFLKWLRDRKFE